MNPGEDNHGLQGRRALVTGAGRGLGRAIALAMARSGSDVAVAARTSSELELVVVDIEATGRRGLAIVCDVTDPEQVASMAEAAVTGLGGIDIVINNAGSAASHKFLNHPDELWHQLIAINLTSVYYVTRVLVPILAEQRWGRIINIASTAARVGEKYVAAYTAAKHGVLGLTRALAAELVEHNITVNAICPGYIDTPLTAQSVANISRLTGRSEHEARVTLEGKNPQHRLIDPDEVASVAVFLAQDSSRGITGQAVNVDGGTVQS